MSRKLLFSLLSAGLVGVIFFVIGVFRNGTLDYWYLPYNLVLALIPLLLALWLRRLLVVYSWKQWQVVVPLALWLLFLPNSFYIITDFIHLPETQRVDIVQDVVMLMQFSMLGLAFGFMSVLLLHKAFLKQLPSHVVVTGVIVTLFLSSFAIYLGRELRWNSWDIVIHPVRLFADVIEVVNPWMHPGAAWMTLSFFLMLASFYAVWSVGFKNK
jgi:uncharacterized membrane protein